jgi:hypothetical protein
LRGEAYDPAEITAIVGAFEDALAELKLVDRSDLMVELVASQIMKLAKQGVLDRVRLRELAVAALRT